MRTMNWSFAALFALTLSACAHGGAGTKVCAAPSAQPQAASSDDGRATSRFVVLADDGHASSSCAPASAPKCDVFASDPAPGCDTKPWTP